MDDLILTNPAMVQKMKWGIPCYYHKQLVCYLNPVKPDHMELCFFRGHLMELPFLDSRKRKLVKGMTIESESSINFEQIQLALDLALEIDLEL